MLNTRWRRPPDDPLPVKVKVKVKVKVRVRVNRLLRRHLRLLTNAESPIETRTAIPKIPSCLLQRDPALTPTRASHEGRIAICLAAFRERTEGRVTKTRKTLTACSSPKPRKNPRDPSPQTGMKTTAKEKVKKKTKRDLRARGAETFLASEKAA
jgi:hypothetical protein